MSVAVCSSTSFSTTTLFPLEKEGVGPMLIPSWAAPDAFLAAAEKVEQEHEEEEEEEEEEEDMPGQFDIWNLIQFQKENEKEKEKEKEKAREAEMLPPPYVHPLVRRSSSLLSQKSLEVCTESLGSETGSDDFDFFSSDVDFDISSDSSAEMTSVDEEARVEIETVLREEEEVLLLLRIERREQRKQQQLPAVNYHCAGAGRTSPPRSFPPPLPSISRRDGRPCVRMQPHRRDGRLVVQAVPVPSQNYLHARRHAGRLLLSFIDATAAQPNSSSPHREEQEEEIQEEITEQEADKNSNEDEGEEEELDEEEEEEEEEVEVVERGTVVEVKVSTQQPQQQQAKVHRSSLVINKFVGGTVRPSSQSETEENDGGSGSSGDRSTRRPALATTTAAAAASALCAFGGGGRDEAEGDAERKMLFTTTRRCSRDDLLRRMRRCSHLRRPLFIWEPCCIATSS